MTSRQYRTSAPTSGSVRRSRTVAWISRQRPSACRTRAVRTATSAAVAGGAQPGEAGWGGRRGGRRRRSAGRARRAGSKPEQVGDGGGGEGDAQLVVEDEDGVDAALHERAERGLAGPERGASRRWRRAPSTSTADRPVATARPRSRPTAVVTRMLSGTAPNTCSTVIRSSPVRVYWIQLPAPAMLAATPRPAGAASSFVPGSCQEHGGEWWRDRSDPADAGREPRALRHLRRAGSGHRGVAQPPQRAGPGQPRVAGATCGSTSCAARAG